ncbi:YkgJ family cysteine cluster protein [bacterium]|nr:MAG: YkgJ family cysteine cluster protein [bacterium]
MTFYENGLRFSCKRCGECCRLSEGYVWLSFEDEKAISDELCLDIEVFRRLYTEVVDKKVVLRSFPNGDCIFYNPESGCRVYNSRPGQCSSFPFWPENLKDERSWRKVAELCPGIGSGRFYTKEDIEKILDKG